MPDSNFFTSEQTWKDWHLMVVVMAFVLIDVITLTVVTAVPEARDAPTLIQDEQNPSTINVRLTNSIQYACSA